MAHKIKPPTNAQRAVLENLVAGRSATAHLYGRSANGGYTATRRVLYRNGWVDLDGITAAGRAALENNNAER